MTVLDPAWLSDCDMERVVIHWTAGAYSVSDNDLSHYHLLIDKDGRAHKGYNPISGNARHDPVGTRTSHVKDLNTGSIGISVAAMGDAVESPFNPGPWPTTKVQYFALTVALAELSRAYGIPPMEETMLMHGEVQDVLGVQQDGKWDIGRLPWRDDLTNCAEVGAHTRGMVERILHYGGGRPKPGGERTVYVTIDAPPGVTVDVKQIEPT